jgi:hypothetical protein
MTRTRTLLVLVAVIGVAAALLGLRASGGGAERPEASARPTPDTAPVYAAAQFLLGFDARTLLEARLRRAHIAKWATTDAAGALQRLYAAEARRLRALKHGFARAALMGYRIAARAVASARVEIWAVSVASVARSAPVVGWRTVAVDLRLEKHRWRVAAVQDVPGPPLAGRASDFRRKARRFEVLHVAP